MRIDCLIPCARREFVQLRVLLWVAVALLAFAAVWLLVALLAHFSLIEGVAAQGNAVLVYVLMIGLFSLLGIFSLAEYLRWRRLLKRCLRSPLVVCHASVSEECEMNGKGHAFRTYLRWRVGDTRHRVTCLSPGLARRARDGSPEILYCEAYDTVLIPGRKTRIRT